MAACVHRCPSKGVGYFAQLELKRERVIIQENKQAAPQQVISTFTLFPLMILLVTPVQSMLTAFLPINFITANASQLLLAG